MQQQHPEANTLKKTKKYFNEWLEFRVQSKNTSGKYLSAWTIQTEEAALNKLFRIRPDDPGRFKAPERKRENIVRSRGTTVRDKHFSEKTNEELINFCKGCGFRRGILERLKGQDLLTREEVENRLKF